MKNVHWLIALVAIICAGCADENKEATSLTTPALNEPLRSLETEEEEGGEAAEEGGEAGTKEEGGEASEEGGETTEEGEETSEEGGETSEEGGETSEEGGEATEEGGETSEEGGEASEEGGETTEEGGEAAEEGGEATEEGGEAAEEGGETSEEGGETSEEGGEAAEEGGESTSTLLATCSDLMSCLDLCGAQWEDEGCEDKCFNNASEEAQTGFDEFMECQFEAYDACGEDEACAQEYCADAFATCFGIEGFCMEMIFLEPTVDDESVTGKLNTGKSDAGCPSIEEAQPYLDVIFSDEEEGPDYCGDPDISGKEDSCTLLFDCDGYEELDGWSSEMTYFADDTFSIMTTLNIPLDDEVLSCTYNLEGDWYEGMNDE